MKSFGRAAVAAVFCAVFSTVGSVHAASIDCTIAKSKVEHLICADKTIEGLDNTLSDQYATIMVVAADQSALVQSQRDWLKQRNACEDASCLKATYRSRMIALAKVPHSGWRTYHDAKLGISFDYLGNRRVVACPQTSIPNCVALVGRDMLSADYLISFNVLDKPLEQAAGEDADFVKSDGRWMTQNGPGEPQAVQSFSGKGWTGLKAIISCGISDSNGFHAGAGDCFWSAISNGKRSVVSDTQGVAGTDADTMRSLNSLRFDR